MAFLGQELFEALPDLIIIINNQNDAHKSVLLKGDRSSFLVAR
jgi:hypothetical protein